MTSGATSEDALPDGILIVDKPAKLGSFDVIRRLKPILGRRKAGFIGTLDPFATGVLPLCLGEATKLADALGDGEKEYVAELELGTRTDSGDLTGKVVSAAPVPRLEVGDLARAREAFLGPIEQIPPMYSAVHVGGERLYEKARRGEVVERSARKVVIHDLELTELGTTRLSLRVVCSKGTYVRVLGEDLARRLGTEGHLVALRRVRSGPFTAASACTPDELLSGAARAGARACVPIDRLEFPGWSALELSEAGARSVAHGGPVRPDGVAPGTLAPGAGERTTLRYRDRLVALAVGTDEPGILARPTRLLLRTDSPG